MTMRRVAVSAAVASAVVAALASCSLLNPTTATTAATPRASQTAVIDPSVPSATPSDVPTASSAAPTPVASATSAAPATTPADSRKAVTPFITSAEWDPKAKQLDVSGIVPSVYEQGGTCTVTATLGGTVKTMSSAAVSASSYTGCETVSLSGLATGSWVVRIGYSSTKSVGTSAPKTVAVG